jgi:peroxiredoxin Q/BCP
MTPRPALRYNGGRGENAMNVNDKAPEFTLPDENGKNMSLKDFRGKTVVLFFFPKADTPG